MNETNTQKLLHLETLGVTIHDYDEQESSTSGVYFSAIDRSYEVLFKDFDNSSSLQEICKSGTEYSTCCGTLIDTDYHICLSCNNRA